MKSAVLTGVGKFEIRDLPAPQLNKETDVLLRIAAVGICGSDTHYFLSDKVGDEIIKYPWILGHESTAIVEETGRQVTRVKPGDRVVIDPAISCKNCDQCLSGRTNTCRNLLFLGYPGQLQGCLSEFITLPQENCFQLPENITFVQGTFIEPLSIGIYAANFLEKMNSVSIGILGSGAIGLSVFLAAKAKGIRSLYMTDKVKERVYTAKAVGADWAGNPDKSDIVKEILAIEPSGLDAVFDCCGDQEALDQAIDLLKPGGELIILGIPFAARLSFDAGKLRRKEISIQNVRRQKQCIEMAIELIAQKIVSVDFMATHIFPLEMTLQAFELAANYGDGVIKAIITID